MISVSAIIPAYNSEKFIFEPIESVLCQTYKVTEIIVVDDGSSDHTAEVAAKFPRTRVIRRKNGGQAAARNTGIRAAQGEWIAFLDHDDIWMPQKTEVQLDCVTSDTGVVHANSFDHIHFGNLFHRQAHITPSGALVRKETLAEVGGFEESRAIQGVEDLALWLKIALTNWRFIKLKTDVFRWRQTEKSQSSNELKMARADLTGISLSGRKVCCSEEHIERIKRASRIEYAKNLIAGQRWDEAALLLAESPPGLASGWLNLARILKINRLARTDLVKWLYSLDERSRNDICKGGCTLPVTQRRQCMESFHNPYFRPPGA